MHTVIIPWVLYQHYHDREFLEKYRENMVNYIELLRQSSDEEHCFNEGLYSYGDWLAEQPATKPFLGMAYYFYVIKLMAQIEDILGHSRESEEYDRLSQEIAQSINNKFLRFDKGKAYYDNNSQSANAHALYFGFCFEKYREMVLASLIDDIDENNRNTTGY